MLYKYQLNNGQPYLKEVLSAKTLMNFENAIPKEYPLSQLVPEWEGREDLMEGKDFELEVYWRINKGRIKLCGIYRQACKIS